MILQGSLILLRLLPLCLRLNGEGAEVLLRQAIAPRTIIRGLQQSWIRAETNGSLSMTILA